MADNRKYYYLKLKENFFDSDSILLLEDMKDGILYSNILLKLYLKSLKNGGKLQLDEHIPYTAQMIATLPRHQICLLYTSRQKWPWHSTVDGCGDRAVPPDWGTGGRRPMRQRFQG